MTSPVEPPAPDSSKDPQIAAFAEELRAAKGDLPALLRPLPSDRREDIIDKTLKSRPRSNVVPAASRFTARRWAAVGSALAVAAGILLFVVFRPPNGSSLRYSFEITGDAEVRGSDIRTEGPVRLRPSTRLVVRIRPEVPGPAAALRAVILREGKVIPIEIAYRVEPGGVFVIDAPARQALGNQVNGPATLVFFVGPVLPNDDEIRAIALNPKAEPSNSFVELRRAVLFDGWELSQRTMTLPEIELAGCYGMTHGPVCEFAADSELRLWVPGENARARFVGVDHAPDIVGKNVLSGTQFRMTPSASAVRLDILGAENEPRFQLPLRAVHEDPDLKSAYAALQKNACEEASKFLDSAERQPANAPAAARIRARHARRCGDVAEAKRLLETTATQSRAAGRFSDEADDRHLLAFMLITRDFDFAAAQKHLWADGRTYEQCPECRLDGAYYRSVWALETGRYEEALRQLDVVLTSASRLDLQDRLRAARNQRTELLAALGRVDEAEVLARQTLADAVTVEDPCVRVKLESSAAWALVRGTDAESKELQFARDASKTAVDEAREKCPASLVNALVNAAYAEVHAGEASKAAVFFSEAQKLKDPADVRMTSWLEALDIELALLGDPRKAMAVLDKRAKAKDSSSSPELVFRWAAGRARALRKMGDVAETRQAFVEAHDALDAWSRLVPLGEGRESFFEQQRSWARESVDYEVEPAEKLAEGSPEKPEAIRRAAVEAERNWGRFFHTLTATQTTPLGEQTDYRRNRQTPSETKRSSPSTESLTSPNSTAVRLVYHPVKSGWVGFSLDAKGNATMARISSVGLEAKTTTLEKPTNTLAGVLLEPFAAVISQASEIEVPAWGPLRRIPWDALPWKNKVLADAAQIRYRMLGPEVPSPACSGSLRALIVRDPSATLAGAEESAKYVREGLSRIYPEVIELSGSAARKTSVIEELANPCTRMFHYDGHAAFRGRDGVHAALELAGEPLAVSDILALPHVPEAIALLGCETAKDEGMGVAQAFLWRGARQVLAAMDTIDDELSGWLARRLYAEVNGKSLDLAAALRKATESLRRQDVTSVPMTKAWWLFRVFSR